MFNAQLVANGYAKVSTFPPDVKYSSLFLDLQKNARDQLWGLWGNPSSSEPLNTGSSTPVPTHNDSSAHKPNNVEASYVGNSNSKKFHYSNCKSVEKMSENNKVIFNSRDDAINSEYTPCKICNP